MSDTTETRSTGGEGVNTDETDRLIASDKVEGTAVYNRDGDRLGSVHTVMIDKALVHGGVRGGTPPASAGSGGANGNRLGDPEHAVEHLDRDGGLALLRG